MRGRAQNREPIPQQPPAFSPNRFTNALRVRATEVVHHQMNGVALRIAAISTRARSGWQ